MTEQPDEVAKAEALEAEGRIAEAVALWKALLEADPQPAHEYRLGSTLLSDGQHEGAERHLKAALAKSPEMAEPRLRLGWLYYVTKRLPEARAILEEGLRLMQWAPGYIILGSVCRSLGDKKATREAFERAVSLDPEDDEALYGLGVELTSSEPARAEELFRRSLSADPNSAPAHRELGFVLWKQGRLEEAEQQVLRSLELDYSNPWAHIYLGNLLHLRGKLDQAEGEFKTARLIWPESTVARNHLGEVYLHQERLEEAEELFRSVLESEPLDYEANLHLGERLLALGKRHEARPLLQRALEARPLSARARKALDWLESTDGAV